MTFSPEQVTLLAASGSALLAALAYLCARRSRWHDAKAEVYQEFADTFASLHAVGARGSPCAGRAS